jgi:transposase
MGISVTPKQRDDVNRELRRTDLTRRLRERLEMVKAAALGDGGERIARWSGRSVETVERWLARVAAGGVAALADAARSGRPALADAAYLAAMETALETPPQQFGLAFDAWTSQRLSAYLEQQTGVPISPGWLRALLAERGWVCGRPKHTLKHLQDPAAVAASRAELAAVGEKGASGAGALRAPLPGRDASGDQSVSGADVASQGQTTNGPRRRDQSARHGVWQRRSTGTRASGTGARGAGHRRVRALSGAPGRASPGGAAGDLSGAR